VSLDTVRALITDPEPTTTRFPRESTLPTTASLELRTWNAVDPFVELSFARMSDAEAVVGNTGESIRIRTRASLRAAAGSKRFPRTFGVKAFPKAREPSAIARRISRRRDAANHAAYRKQNAASNNASPSQPTQFQLALFIS
jgi:hypothetical protein